MKRQIEMRLESAYSKAEYQSKYAVVTFPQEGVSYRDAMLKGRAQDKAILWMLENKEINATDELDVLLSKIQEKTKEILWLRA